MADLKKIKNWFWRDEELPSQPLSPSATVNPAPLTVPTAPLAGVNSEFFASIERELAQGMPVEFTEFYNQMSVINAKFSDLDEATRYQLAFHAAQTALKTRNQNLTPADLTNAISKLVKMLETEKREFQPQNEQGFQTNLGVVQKKVQEMSQGIKDREQQLQALQKEIDSFLATKSAEKRRLEDENTQLISQRVAAEGEINKLQQKKVERETQFNQALEAHHQRLEELKAELAEHLKNIQG